MKNKILSFLLMLLTASVLAQITPHNRVKITGASELTPVGVTTKVLVLDPATNEVKYVEAQDLQSTDLSNIPTLSGNNTFTGLNTYNLTGTNELTLINSGLNNGYAPLYISAGAARPFRMTQTGLAPSAIEYNGTDGGSVVKILDLIRRTTGSMVNGSGISIEFASESNNGSIFDLGLLSFIAESTTFGSVSSGFRVSTLVDGSGYNDTFKINEFGQLSSFYYGNGTFTGTAAYNLSVDSNGNIIETSNPAGGDVALAANNNFTGINNFASTSQFDGISTFSDDVFFDTGAVLNMNSAVIQNVGNAVNSQDAVNKATLDAAIAAIPSSLEGYGSTGSTATNDLINTIGESGSAARITVNNNDSDPLLTRDFIHFNAALGGYIFNPSNFGFRFETPEGFDVILGGASANWGITAQRNIGFPDASGTIPISVNGNTADSSGNITIATGGGNPNIYIVDELSDITGDQSANTGKIWEIIADIDCATSTIDLSTYNITLKCGGGKLTNFTSINLGDFKVENGEDAVFFDQSGTITGQVIGTTYVSWFGLNANASLITGSNINGALPDHKAIQNAILVTPKIGGKISFPLNNYMMQGDGTNPDYTYTSVYVNNGGNITVDDNQDADIGTPQDFYFEQYHDLTILGNGSEIIANPNQSNINNNRGLFFRYCSDIEIRDLKYDGNNIYRDPYLVDSSKYNSQNGFGFSGCQRVYLYRLEAVNCVMDGFLYRSGSENNPLVVTYGEYFYMEKCRAENNYRQGLTGVNAHYFTARDCYFGNTGRNISLVDGRNLTTSPSANVDFEAGISGTAGDDRGQKESKFINCTFENAYGAGLSLHWGSYDSTVRDCKFIDDSGFTPADTDGLTTNNTWENNTFTNSSLQLNGGGDYVLNNRWLITKANDRTETIINIVDEDNHYVTTKKARKTIVEGNYVFIDIEDAAFPLTDITVGKIGLGTTGLTAIFKNNRIVNAIAIKADGSDNTVVSINDTDAIDNNEWIFTAGAKAKYTGNVGRFSVSNFATFENNRVDPDYGSLNINHQSNYRGVQLDGAFASYHQRLDNIDNNDAVDLFFPNADGNIKLTINGDNDTANSPSYQEIEFSTYDPSNIKVINASGESENGFTYTEPFIKNGLYCITVKHDHASRVDGQIKVEWFGQDKSTYNKSEFYGIKYGYTTEGYTFHRLYDGGLRSVTAPTTGGVGNYTEINIGSDWYDTVNNTMKYWNGTNFN